MKYCSKCGKEIDEKKGICENCSNQQKKKKLPKWSIILIIVGAVLFLFIIFVISPNKKNAEGFTVKKGENTVCTFTYLNQTLSVNSDYINLVVSEKTDGGFIITVYTSNDKSGYNELTVDTTAKTVKVSKSTCSVSKDCVYSPAIGNDGAIYCAPHDLKIIPTNGSGYVPPVTG